MVKVVDAYLKVLSELVGRKGLVFNFMSSCLCYQVLLRSGPGHVWAVYSPVMTTVQGVSQRISHGQLHQSAVVSHVP